ncbi:hypothetical protein COLO4_21422 [Corchorus olitorius]|uniref:Aminotransferase-like plant mobile domain-containing protein n=1 Tax=Corchorus olitorius TaxID=93759 RepID=A0A1R3ITB5_9ROSI|nr:hypothetical protein COLO4_21422 [Corchorus olitorius]
MSSSTSIIPSSCQPLFRAYHLIRCRLAPDSLQHHRISISDWVSFWFHGRCRYNDPYDFITVRGKPTALRCPNGLVNNRPRTKDEDETASYLGTHKGADSVPKRPKMCKYSESRLKDDDFEYLVSVRSCYLILRRGNFYLVEPYSPHGFARQFGYCQDVPGSLNSDIRTATLRELLRYWRCSVSRHPSCEMVIPKFSNSLEDVCATRSFINWWTNCMGDYFHTCVDLLKDNSSSKFVLAPRDKDESQILVKPLIEPADSEAEGIDDVTIVHQASEVSNSSQKKLTTVGNHVEQAASSHEPEKSLETLGSGQDNDRCHPRRLKWDAENSTEAASILGVNHSSNPDSTQVKRKKLVTNSDGIKKVAHINSELFGASDSEDEDKIPIDALVRKKAKKGDVTHSRSEESVVDAGVVLNQVKKLSAKIGSISSSGHDTELTSANLSNKQVHANDVLLTSKVVNPHFAATNLPSTKVPVSSVYYPGKYSSRIFENAIKGIGRDFLLKLRDAPFSKVNRVHKDASAVNSGIESLQGDPAPLKTIVDSYVGEKSEATRRLELAKSVLTLEQQKHDQQFTMLQSLKDELTELEQRRLLVQGQQKKVASELQSQIDVVDKAKGEIVSSEKLMSELEATSAIADEDIASIEGLRGTVQTHRDSLVDTWNGGS